MIETSFQASCDRCMDLKRESEPRHSSMELGETTLSKFKTFLRSQGWRFTVTGDLCPECVEEAKAQASEALAGTGGEEKR